MKEYQHKEPEIDDISVLEPEATYSYADYLRWSFEERVELIKGKMFRMSPTPRRGHQEIGGDIFGAMHSFLKSKSLSSLSSCVNINVLEFSTALYKF